MKTRIAGIPCQIAVTHFKVQPPLGRNCDSDWDCYGYTSIEFDVLDRRGRPAAWLERKLTPRDIERIEAEIIEQHNERAYEEP